MEPAVILHSTTSEQCRADVKEFCVKNAGYTFRFRIKNKNSIPSLAWSNLISSNITDAPQQKIDNSKKMVPSLGPLRDLTQSFTTDSGDKSPSTHRQPCTNAVIRDATKLGAQLKRKRSYGFPVSSCSDHLFHHANRRVIQMQDSSLLCVKSELQPGQNFSTPAARLPFSSFMQSILFTSPIRSNLSLFGSGRISNTKTPVKCSLLPEDDMFSVQTPTKAIGESDQQSFHLISPPSIFPSLSSSLGIPNNHPMAVSLPLRPCVLFSNYHDHDYIDASTDFKENLTMELPNANTSPKSVRFSSSTLSAPHEDFDSVAVSTAKATAWSRAQCDRLNFDSQEDSIPNDRILLSRLNSVPRSLSIPIQTEPQLTIRRILQINSQALWREMAFGESETHLGTTLLAQQCLGLRSEFDS